MRWEKLATLIVDKRNLIFLLYIFSLIFCVIATGWVNVENDITTYLPDSTETRQGLTVMNDNFTTYGTARVMVSNITYDKAVQLGRTAGGHRRCGLHRLRRDHRPLQGFLRAVLGQF